MARQSGHKSVVPSSNLIYDLFDGPLFKAIAHRVDKPNHDFPEMISASIGSGLFVSGITLVMIFDFPNYCASHHINISGDRCHQCHQLVSPVQLATLVTRF